VLLAGGLPIKMMVAPACDGGASAAFNVGFALIESPSPGFLQFL
jgi:hypothetical protein